MSTRGASGFYIDGVTKVCYNQSDSYPSGLGQDVVDWIRKNVTLDPDKRSLLLSDVAGIQFGDGEERDAEAETSESLDAFIANQWMPDSRDFLDDSLFCEWAYVINFDDWVFEVYRGFQREPHTHGRYAWERDPDLALVYRDTLDSGKSQTEIDAITTRLIEELGGRQAARSKARQSWRTGVYYPVALVTSYPLDLIPTDWVEQVIAAVYRYDADDDAEVADGQAIGATSMVTGPTGNTDNTTGTQVATSTVTGPTGNTGPTGTQGSETVAVGLMKTT